MSDIEGRVYDTAKSLASTQGQVNTLYAKMTALEKRLDKDEVLIDKFNEWRWQIMGAAAAISAIIAGIYGVLNYAE